MREVPVRVTLRLTLDAIWDFPIASVAVARVGSVSERKLMEKSAEVSEGLLSSNIVIDFLFEATTRLRSGEFDLNLMENPK